MTKKLMCLISSEGKDKKQLVGEVMEAVGKYRKVEKKVLEELKMKEKVKKHLEDSSKLINEIGDFCFERKDDDICRALEYVSSNFDSTVELFASLLEKLEKYDILEVNAQDESININSYKQAGFLIVDQSRFTFVATMSILEFTAKKINMKNESLIKKSGKRIHLSNIINASKKLNLITADEKKEWDFFIEIRNTLVHNNAIVDKDLELMVYGKLYSFKKGKEMKGDIQSLFIFSRRVVELFYDWSQKHKNSLRS